MFANFRFLTEDLCSKACRLREKPSTDAPSTTSTVISTTLSQTVTSTTASSDAISTDGLSGRQSIVAYSEAQALWFPGHQISWVSD